MFFLTPQTLSTLVAFLGVLYAVSATPPRFQPEKRQGISTGIAATQVSTEVSQNSTSQVSTSYSRSAAYTSIKAFSTSNSSTIYRARIRTGVGQNSSSWASTSNDKLVVSSSTKALPISNSTGTSNTQITTEVVKNSTYKTGVCHYAIGVGQSGGSIIVALPTAECTPLASSSSSQSTQPSSRSSPSTNHNATATVTSISCQDPTYWAATVSNWKEEDVDAKLSSWALNQVPNAPTAIPNGSFPTQLPQIFTGFGDPKLYPDVVGIPGQLMALAVKGKPTASCELLIGGNGQCSSLQTQDACGNMPRWAYLAWLAMYNLFSVHANIQGVLLGTGFYQLGQAPEILTTFSVAPDAKPLGLEIFLTILGSITTVIGVLIPLAGVGEAALLELSAAEGAAAARGVAPAGRVGAAEDPDATIPVPAKAPPNENGGDPPETGDGDGVTVIAKPATEDPKVGDPTFIGNALWVAPGVMTSMSNTLWQEVEGTQDTSAQIYMNNQAVVNYIMNHSLLLTRYSDALLVNTDNASINNLLSVLAGGSFIQTNWSQPIFELALGADVVSRQINTAWHTENVGGVYVSYTQLHDNVNGTICNNTHIGVLSTRICADTGVYYLNNINFQGMSPSLNGPPGFGSLLEYGIMPWWPVSASATAYRIMNPNGNVVPPIFTTTNSSIFANFMTEFVSTNQYDLLSTVGQIPGTWTFPVCDQGGNFWTYDWNGTGGYVPNSTYYSPLPCSCGWQGTGTAGFYDALSASGGLRYWAAGACQSNLQYVDPVLPLTEENIGWNKISGGKPPKSIDFGMGYTVTVPTPLPTPCYITTAGCGAPKGFSQCQARGIC